MEAQADAFRSAARTDTGMKREHNEDSWLIDDGAFHTRNLRVVERLRRDGPTPAAFTFRTPFQPGEEHPLDPVVDAEFCWPELAAS